MNRVQISRGIGAWRARRWLPLCAMLAAVVPLLSPCACGGPGTACDLDSLLRQRAGAAAVDCGRVSKGVPSTATDQCIADQTARAAPFHARYDLQGVDSEVVLGVVRDAAGRASILLWDSDPSGGSNVGAQITETVCGGAPPILTRITDPPVVYPICRDSVSVSVVCGG